MKLCTKCLKYKILEHFPVNKQQSSGRHPSCRSCKTAYDKLLYVNKKLEIKARTKSWTAANRGKSDAAKAKWRRAHTDRYAAWASKRRCQQLKATPKWLTPVHLDEIDSFYELAKLTTKITGVPHEVDHVVPIQGKNVSGLHVPWNLQILSQTDNNKKRNKF